jgi:hypothetical protein
MLTESRALGEVARAALARGDHDQAIELQISEGLAH